MQSTILSIVISLLSTGLYATAVYLSFYFVKRLNLPNSFAPLTPLLGLVLILILTPFVFSPLNLIFGKILDPLLNPGGGILHLLEGLGLVGILLYSYVKLR